MDRQELDWLHVSACPQVRLKVLAWKVRILFLDLKELDWPHVYACPQVGPKVYDLVLPLFFRARDPNASPKSMENDEIKNHLFD